MKGYKKALVASLATIGVSCALIGGATFALFSSDSTTDIAVTSGKVNVTASITNVQAYSYQEIGDETPVKGFVNGGTAIYDEETNTLNINNITPGDWVEFDIVLTNESTVDVKYRTSVNTADVNGKELFEALDFTAGDLSFVDGGENVKYTAWTKWTQDEAKEITVHSKVELPLTVEDNNNEKGLQEAECSISFKVEAVQGNANVYDPVVANPDWDGKTVEDAADLLAFQQAVNAGGSFKGQTITLDADIDLGGIDNWEPIGKSTYFDGTFDGNGKTISNLTIDNSNVSGGNIYGLFGRTASGSVIKNLTVENVEIIPTLYEAGDYVSSCWVGGVVGYSQSTIDSITVKGDFNIGGGQYVGGIVGRNNYGGDITNCVVDVNEGSTLTVDSMYGGGIVGWTAEGKYSISDNTVNNLTIKVEQIHPDAAAARLQAGVGAISGIAHYENTFENNTFSNVKIITDELLTNYVGRIGAVAGTYTENDAHTSQTYIRNNTGDVTVITSNGVMHNGGIIGERYSSSVTDNALVLENNNVTVIWNGDLYVNGAKAEAISSEQELVAFAEKINAGEGLTGTYVLTTDMDLKDTAWAPIGNSTANAFNGTFDGNGHTISNVEINDSTSAGFFGVLGDDADVKNFTLNNVNITVDGGNNSVGVGAVAGYGIGAWVGSVAVFPTIDNVKVTGTLSLKGTSARTHVGGIIGYQHANVINCSIDVQEGSTISGEGYVGGLVGQAEGVSGTTKYVSGNTVKNVTLVGSMYVGGITGVAQSNITLLNNTLENVKIQAAEGVSGAGALVGRVYLDIGGDWDITMSLTIDGNSGSVAMNTANSNVFNGLVGVTESNRIEHAKFVFVGDNDLAVTWNA